jgi:hypothetical protein
MRFVLTRIKAKIAFEWLRLIGEAVLTATKKLPPVS